MKLLCKKTARGRVLICSTILTLLFLFPSCNNAFEESARLKKSLKQQTQEQSKEQKEQIEILESDDGFKYSVAGRSVAIYGLSDQTDRVHLVIPAKIDGKPVTEIAEKAFYEEKAIFSVEFPESLEKIGPYAFYGCDNLIKIELPANVKSIENAFRGCDSLETVILNDGIEDISGAFEYAPIETITIPSSVTSMDSAFCDCRNLKNVTLAEGITEVSEYAFWSCQNLKTVNLPKSLIEIKKSAFKDSGLEQIDLPSTLKIIRSFAFENTKLTKIVIPNDIEIVEYAFDGTNIKSINIPTTWDSIDCAFWPDVDELYIPANIKKLNCKLYYGKYSLAHLKKLIIACDMPEDFYDLSQEDVNKYDYETPICIYGEMVEVKTPYTYTWTDEDGTVYEEESTRTETYHKGIELVIEDNVKVLSGKILSGYFTSIDFGSELTVTDFNAKEFVSGVNNETAKVDSIIFDNSSVSFENCILQADNMQFDADVSIKNCELYADKITINTDCTKMKDTVFKGKVQDVRPDWGYNDDGEYVNRNPASNRAGLIDSEDIKTTELVIKDGVTLFPASFEGFSFSKADIPDSVVLRAVPTAFERCIFNCDFKIGQYFLTPEYKDLYCVSQCIIKDSVLKIPEGCPECELFYASDIKGLIVPYMSAREETLFKSTVTMISSCTFEKVTFLASPADLFGSDVIINEIEFGPDVTYIARNTFERVTGFKEIDLSNVTYIGEYAFSGCKDLEKVIMGSNPTVMGQYSFSECQNAEFVFNGSLVMGPTANNCFYGCKKITDLPKIKGEIPDYAFAATGITNLVLSDNIISNTAFADCNISSVTVSSESTDEFKDGVLYVDYYEKKLTYNEETYESGYEYILHRKALLCVKNLIPENLVMPDDITMIGYECFKDCTNLKTVTAKGCQIVNTRAFNNCTNLKTLYVYGTENGYFGCEYYDSAFEGCSSLEAIYDSKNRLNFISQYAMYPNIFKDCSSIKEITFGADYIVADTAKDQFSGCTSLEVIYTYFCHAQNGGGMQKKYSFQDCPSLKKIYAYHYKEQYRVIDFTWNLEGFSNDIVEYVKISQDEFLKKGAE